VGAVTAPFSFVEYSLRTVSFGTPQKRETGMIRLIVAMALLAMASAASAQGTASDSSTQATASDASMQATASEAPAPGMVRKPCEDLRAEIDAKIKNNGVPVFTLDVVDMDAQVEGKVVGSCDGQTKKIVYKRG
jgi:hypothetical protein